MVLYVHIGCLIERLVRNDPIKVANFKQEKDMKKSEKLSVSSCH